MLSLRIYSSNKNSRAMCDQTFKTLINQEKQSIFKLWIMENDINTAFVTWNKTD